MDIQNWNMTMEFVKDANGNKLGEIKDGVVKDASGNVIGEVDGGISDGQAAYQHFFKDD